MTREIKFRAWDINDKKWHTRVHVGTNCGHAIYDEVREQWFEFDEFCGTVVQYTGLQDRNGKEIYEGDILQDAEDIVSVGFEIGQYIAKYRSMSGKWSSYGALSKYLTDHNGEVIGNIYENPELLEGKS